MSERGSKRVFTYGDEDDVSNVRDRNQQVHRTYQLKDWKSLLWAYCRNYGLDWLVLFMMAGYTLFAYVMKPLPNHVFPIGDPFNRDLSAYISFPHRDEIVPTWASGAIALGSNMFVALIAQFWVRSLSDFHRVWMGTLFSVVGGSVFQVTIKFLIGGLRPSFLEICKPDLTKANPEGYSGYYYDRSVCTGDEKEINDALQSFPSGHSMAAWAGLLFLSLYLNGKLKFLSDRRAQLWKMVVVLAPVLGASLLSLVRLLDYSHQWWDILSGTVIGVCVSVLVYRSQYCAVLDYRYNHLPLPHDAPQPKPNNTTPYHRLPVTEHDVFVGNNHNNNTLAGIRNDQHYVVEPV
eukprot:TRINITY_DN5351_c0_g1_i1.p1 TRINITY_DN5351_c0_g1~~TRINITY_DN5351_c0_g1_i1.p1  ORF type:complete len:348 (+),score=62.01 TRINITY_DN5351_c0_g1_i1:232-1275(+)